LGFFKDNCWENEKSFVSLIIQLTVMGKKKTDQNSGVITDPAMGPYFISMDENNFVLMKKYNSEKDSGHAMTVGYYSSFKNCISSVASLLSRQGTFGSIGEYLTNYNSIVEKLNALKN
jgi:hypothetical protein